MKTKPVFCWADTFFSGLVLSCTSQNSGSNGVTLRGGSSPLDRTILKMMPFRISLKGFVLF